MWVPTDSEQCAVPSCSLDVKRSSESQNPQSQVKAGGGDTRAQGSSEDSPEARHQPAMLIFRVSRTVCRGHVQLTTGSI